ncbi:MAG: MarR family transcriptional regulator [Acidimicrobiales bacterium]|nr:MarR family transcriptional regulator [Acidimicrobiales bacterium]
MGPPDVDPIGLQLARTAKAVSRAFDDALSSAGGSLPTWLVLTSLKARRHAAQRDLAAAVGVEGPTLTHHLNRMEEAGLLTRTRDPKNRRVHQVELTAGGEAKFRELVGAVRRFDRDLRRGFDQQEIGALSDLLARLATNVSDVSSGAPPVPTAPADR